jgi:hypothetical protein
MCFPGSENLPVDVFATHPLIHHGARPFLRSRFMLGRLVLGRNRDELCEKIARIAPKKRLPKPRRGARSSAKFGEIVPIWRNRVNG